MNLNLAGFQFARRDSLFDWRLLHGIDVDSVVRIDKFSFYVMELDSQHVRFG